MAGIIARMARANWERKKGRLGSRNLTSDKSNKVLPPFGERFVPDLHNTYLRRALKKVLETWSENEHTADVTHSQRKFPTCIKRNGIVSGIVFQETTM